MLFRPFQYSYGKYIPRFYETNPQVRHCVYKNPPLAQISSLYNPIDVFKPYFSKIHFSIIFPPAPDSVSKVLWP